MSTLENTQPQSTSAKPAADANRCQHRRPSGRQCKLTVTAPGAPFCFKHTQEFNKADLLNLKIPLLSGSQGFQTAQGINSSLSNLYILLANNYISPRRAAVLAYINSLLLRTLPAIDADLEAGITHPDTPKEDAPEENASLESSSRPDPNPDANRDTSAPPPNASAQATDGWDPSIPEPDPTKKPS